MNNSRDICISAGGDNSPASRIYQRRRDDIIQRDRPGHLSRWHSHPRTPQGLDR